MIYSVWNQSLGAFDYFEGGREQDKLNADKPKHIVNRTLGATIDQAAWPLPGNVKKIGTGPSAVGRIATRKSLGSLGDSVLGDLSLTKAALLGVSAFLLWKYVVKHPHRRRA
jgi:hypothetical protein